MPSDANGCVENNVVVDPNCDGVVMLNSDVYFFDDAQFRNDGSKIYHVFEYIQNGCDGVAKNQIPISEEHKAALFSRACNENIKNIEEILLKNGISLDEWCPPITLKSPSETKNSFGKLSTLSSHKYENSTEELLLNIKTEEPDDYETLADAVEESYKINSPKEDLEKSKILETCGNELISTHTSEPKRLSKRKQRLGSYLNSPPILEEGFSIQENERVAVKIENYSLGCSKCMLLNDGQGISDFYNKNEKKYVRKGKYICSVCSYYSCTKKCSTKHQRIAHPKKRKTYTPIKCKDLKAKNAKRVHSSQGTCAPKTHSRKTRKKVTKSSSKTKNKRNTKVSLNTKKDILSSEKLLMNVKVEIEDIFQCPEALNISFKNVSNENSITGNFINGVTIKKEKENNLSDNEGEKDLYYTDSKVNSVKREDIPLHSQVKSLEKIEKSRYLAHELKVEKPLRKTEKLRKQNMTRKSVKNSKRPTEKLKTRPKPGTIKFENSKVKTEPNTKTKNQTFKRYKNQDKENYVESINNKEDDKKTLVKDIKQENKVFNCSMCSFSSVYEYSYYRHKLKYCKKLKCITCGFVAKCKQSLASHSLSHKNHIYKCHLCEFTTNNKIHRKEHIKTHFERRPKTNLRTFKPNKLTVQITNKDGKTYRCFKCDYVCATEHLLNQHYLSHLETKCLRCDHCDYKTNFKGNLVRHVLIHVDEYLYN